MKKINVNTSESLCLYRYLFHSSYVIDKMAKQKFQTQRDKLTRNNGKWETLFG